MLIWPNADSWVNSDPWLVEHHVSRLKRPALLLTFQMGSGSGVYGRAFADAARFALALKGIINKRLTCTGLTGKELPQTC